MLFIVISSDFFGKAGFFYSWGSDPSDGYKRRHGAYSDLGPSKMCNVEFTSDAPCGKTASTHAPTPVLTHPHASGDRISTTGVQ